VFHNSSSLVHLTQGPVLARQGIVVTVDAEEFSHSGSTFYCLDILDKVYDTFLAILLFFIMSINTYNFISDLKSLLYLDMGLIQQLSLCRMNIR
jgi:hypothetical protein